MNAASFIHDDTRRAVRTLWSWLRRSGTATRPSPAETGPATEDRLDVAALEQATILPFPVRGEALLVKLAEVLRRRVSELGRTEGLLPTLSHGPDLLLWIGDDAHVEFDARRSEYDLTIAAPGGTRMIIQTADFDVLVTYVLQYVVERLSDENRLEVAS